MLTLPDTLTELDLMLPPDPTILSQSSGRDTTLLSNPFDISIEYPRGLADEEDPLSQFQNEDEVLDFALDDTRSFSVEHGRDAMSMNLDDEFGSIKGFNDDMEIDLDKPMAFGGDDGLDGGFAEGPLDFGFDDALPVEPLIDIEQPTTNEGIRFHSRTNIDFVQALLHPEDQENQEVEEQNIPPREKLIRKRRLLTADSEIEISKKDYSNHLKDTTNIIKKVFTIPTKLIPATFPSTSRKFNGFPRSTYARTSS